MNLWFLPDLNGEFGPDSGEGWVVMASSATEARVLVVEARLRNWAERWADPNTFGDRRQEWPHATEDENRRWYHGGEPADQVGEAMPIEGPIYEVPVIGYRD